MWELRWILLGLGVLLIAGVYVWSRKPFDVSFRWGSDEQERAEPTISEIGATSGHPTQRRGTDKVVTLRFIGREQAGLTCEQAVSALGEAGLVHGKYGIFHFLPEDDSDEAIFSVANLTEPGSFDIENSNDATIPGMSFFMVLPGPGDPVVGFDAMVQVARALSLKLNAELFDDRGSSWSIQRERYIREEIIEYRHQLTRA